nr:PDZ domain protein [uncultured bacterium]
MFAKRSNNLAVIALSVALGGTLASTWTRPNQAVATDQGVVSSDQKAALARIEDAFTSIADRVEPTVVTISAKATVRQSQNTQPRQRRQRGDDEDGSFGGVPFEFFRQFEAPDRSPSPAGGSGVIVRAQGNTAYILTNNHVVRSRDRFRVSLQDGQEFDATLVGADERSDLAVLKIQTPRPLPAKNVASLGDSGRVRVGQWAIAIGSPLGYDSTFTVGVISAKGRTLSGMGRSSYSDLLQTDASINPGNSGGPLVNIDGEVVGINVAIASAPGAMGNIGIGFAIPANTAKDVMSQLIEKGKVTRGWLGVQTSMGNRELAQELKAHYGVQGGALVEDVLPNSPAQKAGLKAEDVIVRFGDRPVNNFTDLEGAVGNTRPNTRIPVTIVRDRREMTLQVTLEERLPEDQVAKLARGGQGGEGQEGEPARPEPMAGKFGLTVQQPADAAVKGVEVVAVAPGSPAEEAGIRAGDIIEKVGRSEVANLSAYRKAIDAAPDTEAVVLRVRAQGGSTGIRILRP